MLNQLILAGKLKEKNESGTLIEIVVPRSYKNENGEYESDTLIINVTNGMAYDVKQWCEIGDTIGIKGRIEETKGIIEIVAERVIFLSGKKKEDE